MDPAPVKTPMIAGSDTNGGAGFEAGHKNFQKHGVCNGPNLMEPVAP